MLVEGAIGIKFITTMMAPINKERKTTSSNMSKDNSLRQEANMPT